MSALLFLTAENVTNTIIHAQATSLLLSYQMLTDIIVLSAVRQRHSNSSIRHVHQLSKGLPRIW